MPKSTNEIAKLNVGDIVMAVEPQKITIGKLLRYDHPAVFIEGTEESFSENTVYGADQEKLMLVGVPERLSEGIMTGKAKLPIIGED